MSEPTNLECKREPPRNSSWGKREAKRKPVRNGETSDTICHLDDDKLSPTPHLTCLRLPNTGSSSVHASSETSDNSSYHHLSNTETAGLDNCSNGNNSAAEQDDSWPAENVAGPDS